MRSRGCVWLTALSLLLSSTVAPAQPPASSPDPARRLASSLTGEIRGALAARGTPLQALVVPPIADPSRRLGDGAQRVREALLLELAKLPAIRLLTQDVATPSPGIATIHASLDVTGEAVALSAWLVEPSGDAVATTPLLAALPATPEVIASLSRSSLDQPRVRIGFVPAGEVAGPVLAAATGRVHSPSGDDLVLVTNDTAEVLTLSEASFRSVASTKHLRTGAALPPSRDPRAGVAVFAGEPGQAGIWVRPPLGAGYVWWPQSSGSPAPAGGVELPLGGWPTGGFLVARTGAGTNVLEQLGVAAKAGEEWKVIPGLEAPALEAVVQDGVLAFEGVDGTVRVARAPGLDGAVAVGRRGSALALVAGLHGDGLWVLGDRDDGATLVVTHVAHGVAVDAWHGEAPFRLCRLAAGDWDGDGRRDAVAISCGARAALALVRLEEEP